jgi:hypothetical protein
VVFCETQCRHHKPCEALIAADRDHPYQGAYYLHTSTDHTTNQVHTWRTRPGTLVGKGDCQVTSMPGRARLSATPPESRTITVRVRK